MLENTPPESYYYEHMIDVRAIIKTLWNKKWIIVGFSFFAALVAILFSMLVMPPKYDTSSQIGIRRETFYADFEPSIENPSGLEDYRYLSDLTRSLPQLAEAEDIVLSVCADLGLICSGEEKNRPEITAAMLGSNQLKLSVSCEYPYRCAEFANQWAEEVIRRWNALYGNEAVDLDQLALEVEDARENWDRAQSSLQTYLPESRMQVVETQLGHAQQELMQSLLEIEKNNMIIRDAYALNSRLASLSQDRQLALGDALSLIALQQRSTGEISGTQFQLPESVLVVGGYDVAAARENIGLLINSLEDQNKDLEGTIPEQEDKITELARKLENEEYLLSQLIVERDRAKGAYQALAGYLDEVTLNLRYQGKSAYLLAKARIPEEESGQSTLIIVIASSLAASLLAAVGVLIYDWWKVE